MNAPVPTAQRARNRWMLVLTAAVFVVPMLVAGVLRFADLHPVANRQHGELLDPPADLRALAPRLADGGRYAWNPVDRTWRILVAPPAGCGAPCAQLAGDLHTVWQLFGRNAEHVDVLWMGAPAGDLAAGPALRALREDAALRAALPRADDPAGVPVYVVDPNGFVVLRYAPGFDPSHLRQDMSRLLKLR